MATQPVHRRFTIDDYDHMVGAGILSEDDRVELINGEIVEMSPIGGRHVACVDNLTRLLASHLRTDVIVSIQNPIRLGQFQEPGPDIVVKRRQAYGDELPAAEDVLLLMEVADTSLTFDRETKLLLYASAGIPEAWLVDIPGQAIERHTNLVGDTYRVTVHVGRGEAIESTVFPDLRLKTDDILD